jgi:glycosyltransferase involved in cell wall biosynthesis
MNEPLVSCIMPTRNRRPFISAAIDNFLRQTWPNKELIIINDGGQVYDLIPMDSNISIRYQNVTDHVNIGMARNLACMIAAGEIICHLDDDDFSASDRIDYQVGLLTESGLPITGFSALFFWDAAHRQAKMYRSSVPQYVCGTSLCYLREFWQEHPFSSVELNEDNQFVYQNLKLIKASEKTRYMVARIHDGNTSPKDGISELIAREHIPEAFWANEAMIEYAFSSIAKTIDHQ